MSIVKRSVGTGVAIAAAVAVGAVGFGSAAGASTNTSTESFLITGSEGHEYVVAHGAFTAAGVDVSRNSSDVLKFGNGKLVIKHPDSDSTFSFHLNPKTCFATVTGTGSYTLANGNGHYAGVTGSGTYTFTEQAVLSKKADGSCDDSSEPTNDVLYIKASGPVSLGTAT